MSRFLTKLEIECIGDRSWRLTSPFCYASDVVGQRIVVPRGFETDLLSTWGIPVAAEIFDGDDSGPAVVHDFLYSTTRFSRAVSDAVLREACIVNGSAQWRAWIIWAGVRIGGWSHWRPAA